MKLKKLLAVVSALCMCAVYVPVMKQAFPEGISLSVNAAEIVDSGTCGENLTWTLDDEGTLTISGTGEMTRWNYGKSPWHQHKGITSVIIEDGVKSIGHYAFFNCSNLKEVSIPDSVVYIGLEAFSQCTQLTSVVIPDGGVTIENQAFQYCYNLESVTIPESTVSIGWNAFDFTYWISEQRCLNPFVIVNHVLIDARDCKEMPLVIPDGVTTIGKRVFLDRSDLTEVIMPDTVTTIMEGAFINCKNLTSVILSDGLTNIEKSAFSSCSALTSVEIPGSVSKIESATFFGCSGLTSVSISEGVTAIEEQAFYDCTALTSIVIPSTVTSIGKDAFCRSFNLSSVTIKNPECKFPMFGMFDFYPTIYGYPDSTAQAYAENWKCPFELIDDELETTDSEEFTPGDANGDGKVSILDVIAVNKAIMGKASLTDAQLKAIDFNENNKPDPEESLKLLEYIVGLIDSFE